MSDSRQNIAPPAAGGCGAAGGGMTYRDLQRAIFLVAGLFLLYQLAAPLAALLLLFLLSFILAAALNPVAVWLQRWGVPRILSAIGLVAVTIALLGVVAWLALPPLIDQVSGLIGQFHVGQLK